MKLKEIHRTSTFAWSPSSSLPLLATGSVAGALDESFSNESQLEIWAPDFLDKHEYDLGDPGQHGAKGQVTDTARFNRLAWGYVDSGRPKGIIAAGMENGELALWDPEKIIEHADDALVLRNTTHTGPVRGLDFNPIQRNLLSSGAVNGEVYIWDLKDPGKPYSPTPGSRSTKLDDITSVAWNQQVQYVLAGASSTGYTVVWDLRGKREVVALAYGGGAGTLAGQNSVGGGLAMGGRRGMSDIAWHPDNATRLVTASEDDSSPIIMVWDLRNARAPEKILTGHEKGVLSLSWCKQDADLLLSCGKDNRALCWNPQTSEIIGELPSADNWAFQVDWCPRNPDLLATAFFDGTIGIHSLQSTNESNGVVPEAIPKTDGSDVFDVPGFSRTSPGATLSLKQPPKWLRRPTSSSFGFGGKLITVSNLPSAQGQNQSSVVHIRKIVTESEIVERANKLAEAITNDSLGSFAEERSAETSKSDAWKAILSLFRANSREELVTLLGFSKEEIAIRVAAAIENLKGATSASTLKSNLSEEEDITEGKPHEPVVSFLEPERDDGSDGEYAPGSAGVEKTPSEVSASVLSDATSGLRQTDGESNTTVPSLFGDDNGPGTPQHGAGVDFFSTISQTDDVQDSRQVLVPHTNYGLDSSVAATIGSGPSSVTSETMKDNSFRIYPEDESEVDRLVTKALVVGDFESAVSLCLSSDRYADAILLAVKGGKELLERTQKAYFQRQTASFPYLRLFQSIVTNDLADIVQNAELQEWQEIFVVLCTFATREEFSNLAEQLGGRLEFESTLSNGSDGKSNGPDALAFRKNATLAYLAAGRLERLINIWMEELAEEEKEYAGSEDHSHGSRYAAHANALQTFVEKVTVFRSAVKYVDADLNVSPDDTAAGKSYKLASLYDRYFEYADTLASQGLIDQAATYLKLVPSTYAGAEGSDDLGVERDRLLKASTSSARIPSGPSAAATLPSVPVASSSYTSYTSNLGPSSVAAAPSNTSVYPSYAPAVVTAPVSNSAYAPAQPTNTFQPTHSFQSPAYQPPAPTQPANAFQPSAYQPPATNAYAPAGQNNSAYNSLTQPPHLRTQQPPNQNNNLPPPPPRRGGTPNPPPPLGPPPKRDNGGWNDAPVVDRRPPSTVSQIATNKPMAITSPFANAAPSPTGSPYMSPGQSQPAVLPPPPRPGSVQAHNLPPPPQGRMHQPPPPGGGAYAPPHPGTQGGIPPRMMSPPQHAAPPRQMTPGQYAQPVRATPPPPPAGHYGRPPPMQSGGPSGQSPYAPAAPPPVQQAPSMYAPPQNAQRPAPSAGPGPPQIQPPLQNVAAPPRVAPSPRLQKGPPPPKYPPGDRSHIPESDKPAFNVISDQITRLKQNTPPQQKRLVDDLERRINPLFDALNCETLSRPVVERLLALTAAMQAQDRPAALAIHMDLLTKGSPTDDIGLWMSGVKQLIMRL